MKNTTITITSETKRELAIVKYQLDASDYSDTIKRLIKISKEINSVSISFEHIKKMAEEGKTIGDLIELFNQAKILEGIQ